MAKSLIEGQNIVKLSLNEGQNMVKLSLNEGHVVKDDIEYVHSNIIPLFLFGFTY